MFAPADLLNEVKATFHMMFGEVVPYTELEQALTAVDLVNLVNGIPPSPRYPTFDANTFHLMIFCNFSSNPQLPIDNFIPRIQVPTSVFCFFKSVWKKEKQVVSYNVPNRPGTVGYRKVDPHAVLWKSLTDSQRNNWSNRFVEERDFRNFLIANGYCKKAPSPNELQRQLRSQGVKRTFSSIN
ncbi:hypothetical protein GCK72_007025 [Caenorhabditis remanei]|uniref:Uncharacterized protein n=1 Tax=Caenorhabditis remanei TaxID=31234 RepID=A0A6A5HKH2_CAERE|nr:hypothetical protein GCK72_007025 [Caenorhabditis remanei]KAF1767067.1 hypothetical protein GCK72_007025 [Caenorhabditis remanei]